MKEYTELKVWQKARLLTNSVYEVTRGFPKDELFALTNQMRRCAISIPSNLAEGCGRNHARDSLQFFFIARGSLYELETQFYLALDQSYLTQEAFNNSMSQLIECRRLLSGFISYFQGLPSSNQ
ncbi:four helix bundle protein [Hymenobacter sp. BT186]|uniref:Four helix bundle protein n=1 Tax=Hymenobacter telluris TaxID=2816474 RepID=A0A939ESK8_9BACT|nr:four helix bundle protein [Hymenobacter telluris]MBO0356566.1 four helix bundle protein [Hymenobacter telluris]MBW3372591.1 four helix bundle protein [Hymenobacter norwichensis]